MPTNLLLLPLLAGFWFVHSSHRFRFRAQHLDGHRLVLESATAGVILLALSRLTVLLAKARPEMAGLLHWWHVDFAPFPYMGTSLLTCLLGAASAWLDNRFPWAWFRWWRRRLGVRLRWPLRRRLRRWSSPLPQRQRNFGYSRSEEIQAKSDGLRRLLDTAERNEQMISVTLDSRKWYAGYVAESVNLEPKEQYFRLLPILSGYRDKDTLEIRRTVEYSEVYARGVDSAAFHVTIPLATVRIANLFDQDTYEDYFVQAPKPDPAGNDVY
jgi:hypothetical protein